MLSFSRSLRQRRGAPARARGGVRDQPAPALPVWARLSSRAACGILLAVCAVNITVGLFVHRIAVQSVHGRVQEVSWEAFDDELSKGVPLLVRGAPTRTTAQRWFTPEFFREQHDVRFHEVLRQSTPVFTHFVANKTWMVEGTARTFHARDLAESVSMTLAELGDALVTERDRRGDADRTPTYMYISAEARALGHRLRDMLPPDRIFHIPSSALSSELGMRDSVQREDVDPVPTSINVWIGNAGVTARAHYDAFHNVFVQVRGRKRFLLRPPSSLQTLYLFPRVHPSYRQCQIDLERTPARSATFPLYRASTRDTIEVVLEEGDLLYLPPFWIHQVESLSPLTVSMNGWTLSATEQLRDRIFKRAFPFEASWSRSERAAAVSLFVRELVSALSPRTGLSVAGFASLLQNQRFDPILGQFQDDSSLCSSPFSLAKESQVHIVKKANEFALDFVQFPKDLLILFVQNLVEDVASWCCGEPYVPSFLDRCILYHGK